MFISLESSLKKVWNVGTYPGGGGAWWLSLKLHFDVIEASKTAARDKSNIIGKVYRTPNKPQKASTIFFKTPNSEHDEHRTPGRRSTLLADLNNFKSCGLIWTKNTIPNRHSSSIIVKSIWIKSYDVSYKIYVGPDNNYLNHLKWSIFITNKK